MLTFSMPIGGRHPLPLSKTSSCYLEFLWTSTWLCCILNCLEINQVVGSMIINNHCQSWLVFILSLSLSLSLHPLPPSCTFTYLFLFPNLFVDRCLIFVRYLERRFTFRIVSVLCAWSFAQTFICRMHLTWFVIYFELKKN